MKLKVEQNVPYPVKVNKDLVNALLSLKEGDSTFLSYSEFKKTVIQNCIASARIRIAAKGLALKTVGFKEGRRIWVIKNFEN